MSKITAVTRFDKNDRKHPPLVFTSPVIDALGGTSVVARLTGRGPSAVSNWRLRPRFPPNTYLAMSQALLVQGSFAPAWLWDQEAR